MKKMMFCIAMIFAIATTPLFATDSEIQFKHDSFKDILEKGKRENKPVYIDAYASWCGPCRKMAENTFTDSGVAALMNENFISLKIDVESEEGILFQKEYEIEYLPTSFFFDKTGELKVKETGYRDPEAFLTLARRAIGEDPEFNVLDALENKYAAGDTSMNLLTQLLWKKIEFRKSEGMLEICMSMMERNDPSVLKVDTFFYAFFVVERLDYNHPFNKYFREHFEEMNIQYGHLALDKAVEIISNRTIEAAGLKDKKMRNDAFKFYKEVNPKAKKKEIRKLYKNAGKES